MKESILVGIGAFVGANARLFVTNWMESVDPSFAWGTLTVNVTGSLLIGAFYTLIANGLIGEYPYKHFVAIGFCGAFTTVSSYAWQTVDLLRENNYKLAMENFLANSLLPFLAVVVGIFLVNWLYAFVRGV